MKHKILSVVFFFAFITGSFAQGPAFHIKYSEQLAVFVFVQNLSDNTPDNPFKTEFKLSKYNTAYYKGLIAEFDTLAIDYTYQFPEYPYGSKLPGMTVELIKKNLISTDNLSEFKSRTAGLVPNGPLLRLAYILSEFTPVYNELIYTPNKKQFESQLAGLISYSAREDISKYFATGLIFYRSEWDSSIPFEIAFYPLPNSKGFTAQAFYNNFISAIQTDMTDYQSLFSVMMHEIFHILYDEQPLGFKNELNRFFKDNPSQNSTYAYLLLNEALATAMGNGYVFEKLDGKPDPNDWYNAKYINLMAKQVYPLVIKYIDQKKPFDKTFVNEYIKIYDREFPGWINEMDNLMTYRYMLSEKFSDFNTLRQLYRRRSLSEEDDKITERSIDKMMETPITKIIIVSKDNDAKLSMIARKFPELKKWKYRAQEEFEYTTLLNDKTRLFIINQKNTPLETLIKNIKIEN